MAFRIQGRELGHRLRLEARRVQRRPGAIRRGEPEPRPIQRGRQTEQLRLVAIGDGDRGQRAATVGPSDARHGGRSPAPRNAFASATRASSWMPMTSPVDCMDGPTDGSTPRSFVVENAGAFTATYGGGGSSPPSQPSSGSDAPSAMRTASSTIGTPVTLDRNGTVRDARGFTSIR